METACGTPTATALAIGLLIMGGLFVVAAGIIGYLQVRIKRMQLLLHPQQANIDGSANHVSFPE